MGYALTPSQRTQREVRRVARERLDDAIERLDAVIDGDDADTETAIHEVRKRCKETRGLARLVRPAIGDDFRTSDHLIRSAANQLSAMRDAHALLATVDQLIETRPSGRDDRLQHIRDHLATLAAAATASVQGGDEHIASARELLVEARSRSQRWRIPAGFETLERGVSGTYRQGRRSLHRARSRPTDGRLHEWRKAVKYLWYQLRLLRAVSPSVLGPMIVLLDDLAEALGEDHDLAVLVEQLDDDPERFGSPGTVAHARRLARRRQTELRSLAFRSGSVIFAESEGAFAARVEAYWRLTIEDGPERPAPDAASSSLVGSSGLARTGGSVFERERKFRLETIPPDIALSDSVALRQGYLAISGHASVRVRDSGTEGCTLTVKAGTGAERVELEWPIDRASFDAAWPFTEGRRVVKTRHRVRADRHVLEIDVFGGDLDGLVVVEVEFTSRDELDAYEPPAWFGREVTDDARYSNAALALAGRPPEPRDGAVE